MQLMLLEQHRKRRLPTSSRGPTGLQPNDNAFATDKQGIASTASQGAEERQKSAVQPIQKSETLPGKQSTNGEATARREQRSVQYGVSSNTNGPQAPVNYIPDQGESLEHNLVDVQMKLMLLEQQNTKIYLTSRVDEDMVNTQHSHPGQISNQHNFPANVLPVDREIDPIATQEDYQRKPVLLAQHNANIRSLEEARQGTETRSAQRNDTELPQCSAYIANHKLKDYHRMLWQVEQQNKKRLQSLRAEREGVSVQKLNPDVEESSYEESIEKDDMSSQGDDGEHMPIDAGAAPRDYQLQLMRLERQNRKRLLMARANDNGVGVRDIQVESNRGTKRHASQGGETTREKNNAYISQCAILQRGYALRDYNIQLMLLGQQNKKRLLMARAEQEDVNARDLIPKETASEDGSIEESDILRFQNNKHSLPTHLSGHKNPRDYQIGMMMLEKENRTRSFEAMFDHDTKEEQNQQHSTPPGEVSAANNWPDYQLQLLLLEHQNKPRALNTRQGYAMASEQSTTNSAFRHRDTVHQAKLRQKGKKMTQAGYKMGLELELELEQMKDGFAPSRPGPHDDVQGNRVAATNKSPYELGVRSPLSASSSPDMLDGRHAVEELRRVDADKQAAAERCAFEHTQRQIVGLQGQLDELKRANGRRATLIKVYEGMQASGEV